MALHLDAVIRHSLMQLAPSEASVLTIPSAAREKTISTGRVMSFFELSLTAMGLTGSCTSCENTSSTIGMILALGDSCTTTSSAFAMTLSLEEVLSQNAVLIVPSLPVTTSGSEMSLCQWAIPLSDNSLDFLAGSQISERFPRRTMEASELPSPSLALKLSFEKLSSTVDSKNRIKMLLQMKNK